MQQAQSDHCQDGIGGVAPDNCLCSAGQKMGTSAQASRINVKPRSSREEYILADSFHQPQYLVSSNVRIGACLVRNGRSEILYSD